MSFYSQCKYTTELEGKKKDLRKQDMFKFSGNNAKDLATQETQETIAQPQKNNN